MITITNKINSIVASRPKQMYGWPGVVKIAENEILVSASERRFHCCPFGREVVIRSLDGGQSWGLPQEVYNSELDDRDASLAIMPDGTLVLGWFTSSYFEAHWKEHGSRISQKMRDDLIGTWMCTSKDNGHNWENPQRIPVGSHISPIALSDGSLISIGEEQGNDTSLAVYKSGDLGESWERTGEIKCQRLWCEKSQSNELLFNENHVLETSPGNLIAMLRSEPAGDGYLYQSFSEDNGINWTIPHKTDMFGCPPHLLLLDNGAIMCSYSYRHEPFSVRAVFSYDEGKTWDTDNIQTIYEWEDEPDMGYPSSIELSPGKILTVFYCNRRDIWSAKKFIDLNLPESLPEGILSVTFNYTMR